MIRFGLRAQIVVALSVVFVVSFALLGTATLRLTLAAGDNERQRDARLLAELLAEGVDSAPGASDAQLQARIARAAAIRPVLGVRLELADGRALVHGRIPESGGVRVALARGGNVSVWLPPPQRPSYMPLGNLLLFYVGLTGLCVLILTYGALTYLTVRPLDRLTRSSEQLARGAAHVRVPERGAAEVARLAAAFNEMADQLRAEREALEQRLADLEATTRELETAQAQVIHGEKLASVGRLAAGVAHEIGNPLAAILGLVELLRSGEHGPEDEAEFLARIHRETERIHGIIRDLLDFSRRDPALEVGDQTADLAQAVDDAVGLVRTQKHARAVTVDVQLAADAPRVQGPQHRLTQVVLNLLLNALDALEGSGRVEVRSAVDPDAVTLTVSDDGPGIEPEILSRLFEPFTTSKPVGKGTGLGLAVCHALVEAMGGSIEAHNRDEGGACFTVRLRRAGA